MIETRFFFWTLSADEVGHRKYWGASDFHDRGFIEQQGEGWVPVSHSVTLTGDGGVLLTVMANRDVPVPSAEDLLPHETDHPRRTDPTG